MKWREGRVGERGREKEVGESQGPFWEEGGGLRPRKSGFRAEEEGEREGNPAHPSRSPKPHLRSSGGQLGGQILPGLRLGVKAKRGWSPLSQAKGPREQLFVLISEATVAQRGTVTCPRSHSR